MITKPTLLLDKDKCLQNVEEMCLKAQKNGVDFCPHFKTHQSLEIGSWFKRFDVNKIAVSSLAMAEYFSSEWDDITVAFPINILEIETINRLAGKIRLNLLVESTEAARILNQHLENEVGFFIKIDTGYHRTGIASNGYKEIDAILEVASESDRLEFKGFLTHAGHSYNCRSKEEVLDIHNENAALLGVLKYRYNDRLPGLIISVGDTPTCSIAEDFSMFDEIRPGNFVFYDLSQEQIGACSFDQIAVALACPIVAIHEERNEIVIYGGGIHFSKERLEDENSGTIFGRVAENKGNAWGNVIPKMFVKGLSQEHGIVSVPDSRLGNYKIGDILMILPVHSCLTANLTGSYTTIGGETIGRFRF